MDCAEVKSPAPASVPGFYSLHSFRQGFISRPHRQSRKDWRKVVDALGRSTETFGYDPQGRPLSVVDANGIVTDYEYHPRGWLTATKVRGADNSVETDDRITRVEYWPTGLVKRITPPGGAYITYTYDTAQRLTSVADKAGNKIQYTLDLAGNRKQEDTKTASGTLKRTLSRVFNTLGQLQTAKDSLAHATSFSYDNDGNPDLTTDALSRVTNQDHDPLNRLSRTLQDVGGLAIETKLEYNALDQVTKVTDPKGLNTTYGYNGFGDQVQLSSPDTGITTYGYNSAGLLASKQDANDAQAHTYSYDALNRPKTVSYGGGANDVEYDYDTVNSVCAAGENFALGRVTAMRSDGTELKYCYDRWGQLVRKVQTVGTRSFTLRYAYTSSGQVRTITYPDNAIVDYVRNTLDQVTEVGIKPAGGVRTVLLNNAAYEPFGPATGWTYGNGRSLARTYDQDYRAKTIHDNAAGGLSLAYGYNEVGELTELKDGLQSAFLAKYDYDTLGRLKITRDGPTGTPLETYGYDATGNRNSLLHGGITTNYTYPGTSHRLSNVGGVSRGYDAVGNTTSIGGTAKEFVYNANDRMSQVKQAGVVKASYRYNAKGERVSRADNATGAITGYTLYDEAGHWLGDYDANGAATQQAVWMGDAPVGLLAGAGTAQKLHYVQPDGLGTPRAVIDPTRNLAIWTWDAKGEAFGNSPPNQDPDQDSTAFVFNMRLPGQRYDPTTGLNYNYFRDYDPLTGRYIQSDPIGLSGGMSTYLYANGRPGDLADMYGLAAGKECAKCAGSPDKPAHDSWSMEHANDAWMSKISVTNEGGVTVIRGNLTVSGVGAAIAAADVNRYWNGATGNYNGSDYRSEISVTPVDRKGDWRIVPYSFKEWERRNQELCKGEVVATARINSPRILVSPFDSWKKESVMGHEFGHSLGLDHAPNGTGSIMSYDANPKVLPRDLYNLSIGYRK